MVVGDDPQQLAALEESPCLLRSLSNPSLSMPRVLPDESTLESGTVYSILCGLLPGDARMSGVCLREVVAKKAAVSCGGCYRVDPEALVGWFDGCGG